MNYVIKLSGKRESYDSQKLYNSIFATCISVHETKQIADDTAKEVVKKIEKWLQPKSEVSAKDIRHEAGIYLSKINSHAGYLYLHHRIMW